MALGTEKLVLVWEILVVIPLQVILIELRGVGLESVKVETLV